MERNKNKNKNRVVIVNRNRVVIVISLLCLVIIGILIFFIFRKKPVQIVEGTSEVDFVLEDTNTFEDRVEKIKEAQKINKNVYGWISVPGTNIEYPVVFDPSNDNAYWETRTLSGNKVDNNASGEVTDTVVYASRESKFKAIDGKIIGSADYGVENEASKNLVIYGHNWNNLREPFEIGNIAPEVFRMFAQLPSFTDEEFASANQLVYFTTLEEEYIYQIFSVMYTEPSWFDELGIEYIEENPDDEEMDTIVSEMRKRSIFTFDLPVSKDDNIITLSTCTRFYQQSRDDQRYVVSAKLIKESEKDKLVKVTKNNDVKKPTF